MKNFKEIISRKRNTVILAVCTLAAFGVCSAMVAGAASRARTESEVQSKDALTPAHGYRSSVTLGSQPASGQSTVIGEDEARSKALSDAGVAAEDVTFIRAYLDYDDGFRVYDVEFYTATTEYEYEIDAFTGAVTDKSIEARRSNPQPTAPEAVQPTSQTTSQQSPTNNTSGTTGSVSESLIGSNAAKQAALNDAGLTEGDVKLLTAITDYDDGVRVYDVKFYTDIYEYEYEINAVTGAVTDKSVERIRESGRVTTKPTEQGSSVTYISANEAKLEALNDAGLSQENVKRLTAIVDYDDGVRVYDVKFYTDKYEYEYEINAVTGAVMDKSVESYPEVGRVTTTSAVQSPSGTYISVDDAKATALSHAGFKASDVTFIKAKLENDDGRREYEIEFIKGYTEYEYSIDAQTGAIIEYDSDYLD